MSETIPCKLGEDDGREMSPELDKLMLGITAQRKLISDKMQEHARALFRSPPNEALALETWLEFWGAINEYDHKVRKHETLMRLEQAAACTKLTQLAEECGGYAKQAEKTKEQK